MLELLRREGVKLPMAHQGLVEDRQELFDILAEPTAAQRCESETLNRFAICCAIGHSLVVTSARIPASPR